MGANIRCVPDDMLQSLEKANATRPGKCFDNCVIAVLGLRPSRKLQYVLGFVIPPGYSPVQHAWLGQETQNGFVYLDPTLQSSSQLWRMRKDEFVYIERHSFTKEQLLKWFQTYYRDRKLTDLGIPEGPIRGPMLNATGELE